MDSNDFKYTYDPDQVFDNKKKMKGWKKGLIIFGTVIAIIIVIALLGNRISSPGRGRPYVGIVNINGVIGGNSIKESYNQDWVLNTIDMLEDDDKNRGLLIAVDSPGGSVYDTAEVYAKLLEYKEKTGRPVYAYMKSMAASGGYYISMAADKVYANENCWTGSIGVIVGTMYDYSKLLDKIGVKGTNITSGPNKAMGRGNEPLTEEQKAIFQSIVDESYDTFVDVVCKGRKMDQSQVRKLADGRIYSGKQAAELNLIDGTMLEEEAIDRLKKKCGVESDQELSFKPKTGISSILGSQSNSKDVSESLMELIEDKGKFTVTYLAPIDNR